MEKSEEINTSESKNPPPNTRIDTRIVAPYSERFNGLGTRSGMRTNRMLMRCRNGWALELGHLRNWRAGQRGYGLKNWNEGSVVRVEVWCWVHPETKILLSTPQKSEDLISIYSHAIHDFKFSGVAINSGEGQSAILSSRCRCRQGENID